jgi:GNAT superfamily N-acetyltransferase
MALTPRILPAPVSRISGRAPVRDARDDATIDEGAESVVMPDDTESSAASRPRPAAARAATSTDVTPLSRSLARAFATDPVWEYLCGGNFSRFEQLAVPFFEREVRHNLELDGVTTIEGVHAGALWAPPDKWKLGVLDVAKLAPSAIRLFGRRLPLSLSVLAETDKVHPTEPHWYLGFLGTDPDHQGKGLGSAVLGPVLGRCDAEGIPAYLESSKEANVPFYERHGFAVRAERSLPAAGPPGWGLVRAAQPASAAHTV